MTRFGRRLPLLVLLLVLLPAAARAQAPSTGALTGTVTDALGTPLRDVLVTMTEPATGARQAVFTDRFGSYRFAFLQPGTYDLRAERLGFQPAVLAGVPVRPGHVARVDLRLPESGPAAAVDSAAYAGGAIAGGSPGSSQWAPARLIDAVPFAAPRLDAVARMFSNTGTDLGAEGLPGWLSSVALDGYTFRPVPHPAQRGAWGSTTGFATAGISSAQFLTIPSDVEWDAGAGGILAAHALRGTAAPSGFAAGAFGGASLAGGETDGADVSATDFLARAAIRGPLLEDSARFAFGVDVQALQSPATAAWPGTTTRPDQFAGYEQSVDNTAFTLFGRFDWKLNPDHQVETTAQVASLPKIGLVDPLQGTTPLLRGTDILAGVTLNSLLGDRVSNAFRVSFSSAGRETESLASMEPARLVDAGLTFGGATVMSSVDEVAVRLSDALHLRYGAHTFKLGADVAFDRWDVSHRAGAGGTFTYPDAGAWMTGTGSYVETEGSPRPRSFNTNSVAFFAQDYWSLSPGVDVQAGVRVERQVVPGDDVRLDTEFQRLAGVANTTFDEPGFRISPRGSITWDVSGTNRWVIHLAGGIFNDRIDPLLLAQWQDDDGTSTVFRVVGDVSDPSSAFGWTGTRLTLLGPGFDAPSTSRVGGGFSLAIDDATALQLSASVRRTENLPRRTDLNLIQSAAFRDQDNRPVYGELRKFGGLVVAEPGSNRRFEEYDDVAALSSDGTSDYVGVNAALVRTWGPLQAALRYTWSETEDNWYGARQGGWTVAMPRLGSGDWVTGTSDFDVTHRVALSVAWDGPGGIMLGGLFRYESGLPFTPGFRDGVDINGDGWSNDPAFVDRTVTGLPEVISAWPCLAQSEGTFAARNSCRGDARQFLDLAVQAPVLRFGGAAGGVFAQVFNVLDSRHEQPDAALYLVDPGAPLGVSGARVTVPLVANPNFGEPLGRRTAGRLLRLGVSLNW